MIQISIYCGAPAGIEAFRIAREVFKEEGIDVDFDIARGFYDAPITVTLDVDRARPTGYEGRPRLERRF